MSRFWSAGLVTRLTVRLTIFSSLVIALAILIQTPGALANDSTAAVGAGGIVLTKNEHIRMLEEILEVSTKEVKVKYRFLNESDNDIHATVAFPVPPYDPVEGYLRPEVNSIMTTFKVLADGRPVAKEIIRKAVLGGRDVTDQLRKSGLSDKEIFFDVASSEEETILLEKLHGLVEKFGHGWSISETAFWQQDFSAGKEIVIEHSYEPVISHAYPMVYYGGHYDFHLPNASYLKESMDEVCLDDGTKRAIEIQIKSHAPEGTERVHVTMKDVEYILGTGRNWKGPIGEFTLRIKKEKPDEFVSLCFPGKPKKISPTVFEFHEKDFVPPDKLVVYFYSVGPEVSQ